MLSELDKLAMNHPGGNDRSPNGAGAHPYGTGHGASNPPNQYTNTDQPEVVHQPLNDPFDTDYEAIVDDDEELRFFTQRLRVFCTPINSWPFGHDHWLQRLLTFAWSGFEFLSMGAGC